MILKILVMAAVIAVVWYGFKLIARRNKAKQAQALRKESDLSENMAACPVCGTFVPDSYQNCGREKCPYTT